MGLDDRPFPILIRLGELAEHIATSRARNHGPTATDSPLWLAHFLATNSEDSAAGLDEAFFRARLENGSSLVLLDGLDEAPSEQQRKWLTNLVQRATQEAYEKCRFVLTSRPGAYQGETVLPHFAQVEIAALEDEAIKTFLTRWCEALFAGSATQVHEHLKELLAALNARPEIRRMARNPVMLTALAVVHWHEMRLPEQRADLYESIISWLARSRLTRQGRPSPERCVALHQELALAVQDHPRGRQTQVTRFEAAGMLAGQWRDASENERVGLAQAFLDQEELDSGIVVRRGDHLRFWHLTFQEYLAARALASRSEGEQRRRLLSRPGKLYQPEWREAILLAAGILHHHGVARVDAMFSAVLKQLYRRRWRIQRILSSVCRMLTLGRFGHDYWLADQAQCFGLLGAAVRDLTPVKYQPGDPRYQEVADSVMGIFDAERSRSVDIKVAIEAAEALGQAVDPRFAHSMLDANWVTIPEGDFLMGAQDSHPSKPNYDPNAYGDESPVHKVRLEAYRIGKYPVTVAEYRRFMDDGGYKNQEYWQAGGFGETKEPDEWQEQLSHPNRPVIYVSWFEASAYAAWATRLWPGCRLPTEAEWERAARGIEGRKYPWGNDKPDSSLVNFKRNVGRPTPVGVYPRGGTPDELQDMAGNVWEWCQDVWHDNYKGAPSDGSAWKMGGDQSRRVLRGGSWYSYVIGLRSACRGWYSPDGRFDAVGFRVAAGTYPLHS